MGSDFYLAYSPEREDPGRQGVSTSEIPKLVGGTCGVSSGSNGRPRARASTTSYNFV